MLKVDICLWLLDSIWNDIYFWNTLFPLSWSWFEFSKIYANFFALGHVSVYKLTTNLKFWSMLVPNAHVNHIVWKWTMSSKIAGCQTPDTTVTLEVNAIFHVVYYCRDCHCSLIDHCNWVDTLSHIKKRIL